LGRSADYADFAHHAERNLRTIVHYSLFIHYKEFYMKKTGFAWGTLVIGMAFSLALAGCGSAPQAGGGGGASAAVDLVPALGGKAKVEGGAVVLTDTVVLTEYVRLQTALIVPSGITLDLTADGAVLELQDGAVLTVDGTVNATGHGDHGKGWVEGSLRIGNGAVVINGSGTIRLASKGRLLNIWGGDGKRHLTLDGVTLVGLEDNDASLVEVSESGELVLKSGAITGNTRTSDDWASGGGVNVHKGTFTMEGGAISGNSAIGTRGASGGGVNIGEESVFTMIGGVISGNRADGKDGSNGGGVRIGEESVFTMTGGTISGNSVEGTGDRNREGGGVSVGGGGTFVMKGGAIKENTLTSDRFAMGGGVFVTGENVEGVSFIMEGGTIYGNIAKGKVGVNGGGVMIRKAIFTMKGGEISGNIAQGGEVKGGGVRFSSGNSAQGSEAKFTMSGGAIFGNSAQGNVLSFGGGVLVADADTLFIMEGGRIQGGTASDGFAANTVTGSIPSGAALHLDNYEGSTVAKWGTGGRYTKGGASQTGSNDIVTTSGQYRQGGTDDTLIAIPAK
jgi:hypothetical protein